MQNAAASLAAPLIASLLGAFLLVALVSIIWVIVSRRRKRRAAEPAEKTPAVEGTKGSLQDLEKGHNAASSSQVHSMRIKASVRIKHMLTSFIPRAIWQSLNRWYSHGTVTLTPLHRRGMLCRWVVRRQGWAHKAMPLAWYLTAAPSMCAPNIAAFCPASSHHNLMLTDSMC